MLSNKPYKIAPNGSYSPLARQFLSKIAADKSVPGNFSNEDALLAKCANPRTSETKIRGLLKSDINWDNLVNLANSKQIAPLIYQNLQEIDRDLVPKKALKRLYGLYNSTLRLRLIAWDQFKGLANSLGKAGVEFIPLKGLILAETVYPHIAVRPSIDLDILVRKENLSETSKLLSKLGYQRQERYYSFKFCQQVGVNFNFMKENNLPLDLHWHIIRPPYSKNIRIDKLWESAVTRNINGQKTLVLSPENQLLHLCLHFATHGYAGLLWLIDISELIHTYHENLDWKSFLKNVKDYKVQGIIERVLGIVRSVFEPPIPEFVLEEPGQNKNDTFEGYALRALANPKVPYLKWPIAEFLSLDGIGTKLRYLTGKVFPRRKYMEEIYPDRNLYLAYFLRLRGILKDGFKVLWRALRG